MSDWSFGEIMQFAKEFIVQFISSSRDYMEQIHYFFLGLLIAQIVILIFGILFKDDCWWSIEFCLIPTSILAAVVYKESFTNTPFFHLAIMAAYSFLWFDALAVRTLMTLRMKNWIFVLVMWILFIFYNTLAPVYMYH